MLSGSWVRAEFAPKSPTDAQREQGRRGCICWEKQRHELSGAAKYRPAVLPQLNLSPAHRGCRRTKKAPKAVRGHRGLWSAVGVENGDFSGLKKKIHVHKLCNGKLPEKPSVVGRECTGTVSTLCNPYPQVPEAVSALHLQHGKPGLRTEPSPPSRYKVEHSDPPEQSNQRLWDPPYPACPDSCCSQTFLLVLLLLKGFETSLFPLNPPSAHPRPTPHIVLPDRDLYPQVPIHGDGQERQDGAFGEDEDGTRHHEAAVELRLRSDIDDDG